MQRYLFRVQYTHPDGSVAYESVCVRAADGDEAGARAEVEDATTRYMAAAHATRTLTVVLVTADV